MYTTTHSPRVFEVAGQILGALALLLFGSAVILAAPPLMDSPVRSFTTGDQIVEQGYRPSAVKVADLDGDGDVDAAIANYGNFITPHVTLMFNNGDGTYAPPVFLEAAGETMDVVIADLDGDGDPDLAFAQSSSGITGNKVIIYRNLGGGSFDDQRVFATGVGPTGIAAFDADGDGDIDLATANNRFNEEDVTILFNDGNASFTNRADVFIGSHRPSDVAAGDLDGDGDFDLAVSLEAGADRVALLFNNGSGVFGAPVFHDTLFPYSVAIPGIAIHDIDLDGDADVLYGHDGNNGFLGHFALYRNDGSGTLGVPESIGITIAFGGAHDFAIGDMTGDGWPDVAVVAHSSKYGWALVPSDGAGGFGPATAFRSGEMAQGIAMADADQDGDLDALIANAGSLTLSVHENEGVSFSMPEFFSAEFGGARETDVGDIDQDGDLDIVAADYGVITLENDGDGNFTRRLKTLNVGSTWRTRLADVDGDLFPDLLLLDQPSNPPYEFHVLLNDGTGRFGTPTSYLTGTCGSGDFVPVDFDNDGDLDVVVTDYLACGGAPQPDRLRLHRNMGDGTYVYIGSIKEFGITKGERLLAADLDHDGNQDLLTTHSTTIAFWRGDGSGGFASGVENPVGEFGPKYFTFGDFNRDGERDVATVNYGDSFRGQCISVVLGNGDGSFGAPWVQYGVFSLQFGGIAGIDAIDVDGDGILDITAGAYGADDIAVFLGRGDGTFDAEQRYGVDGQVKHSRAGDFNGDGLGDVAAVITLEPPIEDGLSVLFATGDVPTSSISVQARALTPQVVPGSFFEFVVTVTNGGAGAETFDGWLDVFKPNGLPWSGNPIAGPKSVTLAAGQTIEKQVSLRIPASTPPSGPYRIDVSVGGYPAVVSDTASVQFEVVAETP